LAAGATIFAQYGRDKSKLPALAASSFRYLALTSIPLHFISAALAIPALLLLYGNLYKDAAVVVTLAPLLCLPKAFLGPAQSLLESIERQAYIIFATVIAGILDLSVAWYLIPAHGAVGACVGSGVAQITAVGLMWAVCIRLCKVKIPWVLAIKVACSSVAAALTAHYISIRFAPLLGILLGGSGALLVLLGLFYLLRVLEPEDRTRLSTLTGMLPNAIAAPANSMLFLLAPAEPADEVTTNI
jgi:O-antigen/teichoic acid export membrane protein